MISVQNHRSWINYFLRRIFWQNYSVARSASGEWRNIKKEKKQFSKKKKEKKKKIGEFYEEKVL